MTLRRALSLIAALAFGVLLAVGIAGPAGAVDNPTYTAPPPTTPVTSPPPTRTEKVETAVNRSEVRTRLAITGSDTTSLFLVGTLLLATGVAVMYARHRHLTA